MPIFSFPYCFPVLCGCPMAQHFTCTVFYDLFIIFSPSTLCVKTWGLVAALQEERATGVY